MFDFPNTKPANPKPPSWYAERQKAETLRLLEEGRLYERPEKVEKVEENYESFLIPDDIGERLRAKRLEKRLDAVTLANMAGIPFPTYQNWESGRSYPTLARVDLVLGYLDEDLEDLLKDAKPGIQEVRRQAGRVLKRLRGKKTLDEYAGELGVNKNTLNGWERGHSKPQVKKTWWLLDKLGMSVDEFLEADPDAEEARRYLGKAIKKIRGDENQKDFAKRLGIARSYLSLWESGKSIPTKEFARKVLDALDMAIEDVLEYVDE